jgi:predicted small secreted protein
MPANVGTRTAGIALRALLSMPGLHRAALPHRRTIAMRKNLSIALTLLALLAAAPLLGACHTTAGMGEDLSATGHAVTNDANKSTP